MKFCKQECMAIKQIDRMITSLPISLDFIVCGDCHLLSLTNQFLCILFVSGR